MNVFQPWSDTINLLASGSFSRPYEAEEVIIQKKQRRIQRMMQAGVARLLLIVGIT